MSYMIQTVRLVTKLFTLEQYTQGVVSISNESGEAEHRISLAVLPCVESASQAHNFMVSVHQCCHHNHRCCGQMFNMGPDLGTEREL